MNEELNQINNDIKDLESRLSILKDRKQQIQSKLTAPDLVGKYIYYIDDNFTYYMKVNRVDFSNLAQSYIAIGASICIAVDIYKTKQAELAERRNEAEKRAFNQHIDEIIAEKKEADLRGKSIEELEAMRRK